MPAIVIFAVWKNFGHNMIILLAGIQSIPDELYEAARIDGAGAWAQFSHVTLPALAPIMLVVSILTNAGDFKLLDRKSVVKGKSESVRIDVGGRRIIKKKTQIQELK